jgi:protein-glucosylgalactosylhydroxylysine glucosidase
MIKHILLIITLNLLLQCCIDHSKINREAVVKRHNITLTAPDPFSPLTVGNGEFAFTADITGMQSFPGYYENGITLGTFSQWAWHSFPNTEAFTLNDVVKEYNVENRVVPYWYQFAEPDTGRKVDATNWLRENPHRLHLGHIGLEIRNKKKEVIDIAQIKRPVQKLNLWTGELKSTFEVDGIQVEVTTYCHQSLDMVSFKIESELIELGRLKVTLKFPYAAQGKFNSGYDYSLPDDHSTNVRKKSKKSLSVKRKLHSDSYYAKYTWGEKGKLSQPGEHEFHIIPSDREPVFEFNCLYSNEKYDDVLPTHKQVRKSSSVEWNSFWESGAAVDFSKSTDPRAKELERRVVLSQYLTKIQCSGSLPPQETGLTTNSWFGKFHLEMHWWHAAHFIQWNRSQLIEEQLDYYFKIYSKAEETARWQGYDGVRWPKMTDGRGVESPSSIGVFLIWQQPHIIYLTELLYQASQQDVELLEKYYKLVESTADFMVSYARWDSDNSRYVLGPALIPAQECFKPETTINPVFELAYWKWGLQTAQNHRVRLGLGENTRWQHVIDKLSSLPQQNGLYLFTEDATDSYTNKHYLTDHPIVLAIAGFLPVTDMVDKKILKNSFDSIVEKWNWHTCWGWDFPIVAMCATVLDEPSKAIDFLLMDTQKNSYLPNGHNYQDATLPLYLPGNGGLLSAVSMMCTYRNLEGDNGFAGLPGWKVRYENMGEGIWAQQSQQRD